MVCMPKQYDVIVIGAGPIGSYTAHLLAERGFAVALIEEDTVVGKDVICTGIIGEEAFRRFDLPSDSVLKPIQSIEFFSPTGRRLQYVHAGDLAYVVDRARFDGGLLEKAVEHGVEVRLGEKVVSVKNEAGYVEVESMAYSVESRQYGVEDEVEKRGIQNSKFKVQNAKYKMENKEYLAKVAVIATGVNCRLQGYLGMGTPPGYLLGAQTEIKVAETNSAIEIYTGQDVVPGSFGWIVPLGNGQSRVGVLVRPTNGRADARFYLERLLKDRLNHRIQQIGEIRQKPIAYGPLPRTVVDRALAVGEAAGQIKTTTGGGIFYGLLSSELAAQAIAKFLHYQRSGVLIEYERAWRKKLNPEVKAGYLIRGVAENIDDAAVDRCFEVMKRNSMLVRLIYKKINFEYHSGLLSALLKMFRPILR